MCDSIYGFVYVLIGMMLIVAKACWCVLCGWCNIIVMERLLVCVVVFSITL
jgi:hypothetical protein